MNELATDALALNVDAEIDTITAWIRSTVGRVLRRRGAVVGVSGGVDSAVCLALCAVALGRERAVALLMPERDSSPESTTLGRELASTFGVRCLEEDITATLDGFGCETRQLAAIRTAVPDFGPGWRFKLALPPIVDSDRLNLTRLVVEDPAGVRSESRLTAPAYQQLVAATNFKQRSRTAMEYFHADALHFAVCGTPNRLEYDQGFFVKGGDGLADFKPIAHLYKSQVYEVGRALGVPDDILARQPTTDTFSLPQSQDEFYFSLPYDQMDMCLYAVNNGISASAVAGALGLSTEQISRVFADIAAKRRATATLHLPAQLVRAVAEIDPARERPD